MYYNTKKLKPGLVTFYNIRPGNEAGLFSKEQISKGGDKSGKSEENKVKWSSGKAYDIKKVTVARTRLPSVGFRS